MYKKKLVLEEGFCDECCYDDNPRPELRCNRIKCCYLVRNECMLVDGYMVYK